MFQLSESEWEWMSSQFVMTYPAKRPKTALPIAFTEHGVTMLANVLKSKKARQTSIAIVRAFASENNISTFTLPKPNALKNSLPAVFICAFLSISLNSSAQDYLITFAGTGASATVSTVEVENLATGKSLILNGGDTLHLTSDHVGISQLEKINSSMNIYPNPMMDNSILALHPPEAGDAVITVFEMTGKTVAKIHAYLENSRQEFRLSGLQNGLYLINARGNSFQYSVKILSMGQSDRNPGIEKISNTSESKIEKIARKEFSAPQGTVEMHYTEGDRLKFKAISGIYSTVKTDIPTDDKTLSFSLISCTDVDNNNYPVVEIGSQIWMAENLKTTKYNDGLDIPLVTDGSAWAALSTPGFCWYRNDSATYNGTYGALYNWYTIKTAKLCPMGWHGATDTEWNVLTDYLGGGIIAGGKLKEAGLAHWLAPNEGATNETGFTALPGGYRAYSGHFSSIVISGYWWCTPEVYSQLARCWNMSFYFSNAYSTDDFYRQTGFSVRCLRDSILTTQNVTEITTTTAKSGGNIFDYWGYPITARGVCWSSLHTPTVSDSLTSDGKGTGVFTSSITGLQPNLTYFLRAYYTNSEKTVYGNLITFKTFPLWPIVSTTSITNITQTSAISGGNIIYTGVSTVTARGVCWSTHENPTIADSKTTDGPEGESFISTISGTVNTKYYVRAYATNSFMTSYGNEIMFATKGNTGSVTDIDENAYSTIEIGNQIWMVENLKTTKYNNDKAIPLVTNGAEWSLLSTPGYCWYNNDASNKTTYGALYNWYTVNTGNLCPRGWHVPSDAEWTVLIDYLGGESIAGYKLKEVGFTDWLDPNNGATNETGFTALPGGERVSDGTFSGLWDGQGAGAWWGSTENGMSIAWIRSMNSSNGYVYRNGYGYKQTGVSVRCLRY